MNSIYFGLALIAILVIVHWYVINDGTGQNDGSIGFLAMKPSKPPVATALRSPLKKRFRRMR
jgi:hypothetical protein